FTVRTAAEIDVGNGGTFRGRGQRLGRIDGGCSGDRLVRAAVVDGQHQAVAVDAGAIAGRAHQFDHDPGAPPGRNRRYARGRALADVQVARGGVVGIGQVDRNARRVFGREDLRLRHRTVAKVHVQLDAAARQGVVADVLQ